MSSDWREATWGEEISLEYGKGIRGYKDADANIPVFGTNGQVGWTEEPLADGPGIILGRKGAYRGINYSKSPFFVIDTAYYVKPKSPMNMRWLYYTMTHHKLGSIDDGSPIPSTTRAAVYVRNFKIPNDDTQMSIAKILGDLDDKIDLLLELNRTLESIAQAVFRAWFVDFEPVRAKAAGATSFRGMPQELFDSLPDNFEPSEIGEIPLGWAVGRVADVVKLSRTSIKPYENADQIYQHFSLPAYDRNQEADLELGSTIKSGKYAVPKDSVLFSKLNPRIPRVWLPRLEVEGYQQIESTEFLVCIAREGWSRPYAYCLFTQPPFIDGLTKQASGTSNSHQRVKPDQFEAVKVPVPPQALRDYFAGVGSDLLNRVIGNREERGSLASLRDTLLPKLVSGELEAPSLETLGLAGGE